MAMADTNVILPTESSGELPVVRSIGPADVRDALVKGFQDFWAMPTHAVFLCLIYPIVGFTLAWAIVGYDVIPLLYPLAAGFALIGPFAAIGLYELSRRRELGLDTSWEHVFDIIHSPSFAAIAALGLLLLSIFVIWMFTAQAIYVGIFGESEQPLTLTRFVTQVLTTPEGYKLIVIGNAVGFLFALLAYALSVVSFPLLLDRNVGVAAAIITSFKVILKNPFTMALWGLTIVFGLIIGFLPVFIGLAVVIPILGHATWHLYRKAVEPDATPRPEYHPIPRGRRPAADFPVSLFVPTARDEK
jgi:uncharacterized membrane protein